DGAEFPYVPGKGLPAPVRKATKKALWEKGTGKPKAINFVWKKLEPYEFVRLDRDHSRILLNSDYRRHVLDGRKGSVADVPFIKLLLFFLFQQEFDRQMNSGPYINWLKRVNEAMVLTLGSKT